MSQLVVDSAVAVKWFLPEPHAAQAWDILAGYRQGDITLLAPDLIYAEFGSVIWKKHLFHGLAADDAQAIIAEFQKLEIGHSAPNALERKTFPGATRGGSARYGSHAQSGAKSGRCKGLSPPGFLLSVGNDAAPHRPESPGSGQSIGQSSHASSFGCSELVAKALVYKLSRDCDQDHKD